MKKNLLMVLQTFVFVVLILPTYAQTRSVSGTITDATGSALPGVNVLVKGTTKLW